MEFLSCELRWVVSKGMSCLLNWEFWDIGRIGASWTFKISRTFETSKIFGILEILGICCVLCVVISFDSFENLGMCLGL